MHASPRLSARALTRHCPSAARACRSCLRLQDQGLRVFPEPWTARCCRPHVQATRGQGAYLPSSTRRPTQLLPAARGLPAPARAAGRTRKGAAE